MTITPEDEADCLTRFGVIAMALRAGTFDGDDLLDVEILSEAFREVDNTPDQIAALDRIDQEWHGAASDWAPRLAVAIEAYCMTRLLSKTVKRLEGAT